MSRSVDLFKVISDGTTYLMTSASKTQTHETEDYLPTAIGRGSVTSKAELSKASMEVRIALDHPLAQALLTSWAESITSLTIFSKRSAATSVIWKGRLTTTVPEDDHLKLVFESIYTSMRRPGLRAKFQKACRHALYGRGCGVLPADFAEAATVSAISGVTVTSAAAAGFADGYFAGGMLASPDGTFSYVSAHVGSALTMNRISGNLAAAWASTGAGLAVTLYPGCDKSYSTCENKFSNDDNYGGFDYIPTKNPMGGQSIV